MCHGTEVRAWIRLLVSPGLFIWKSSSILSIAPSASSLHPLLHKAVFAYVPPVVTAWVSAVRCLGPESRRSTLHQPPGRSHENSSKQLPPYPPDNHYISVREEDSINAAGINKPACFLFQSKDKDGVCSARQYSQALQGRQEKMRVFLISVWIASLETGWA